MTSKIFQRIGHFKNCLVLFIAEKRDEWDSTGQRAYERACEKFGAVPSRRFYKGLGNATEIDLSNYGTGPRGTMAAAIPLVVSIYM
jgi:hypothetical protein